MPPHSLSDISLTSCWVISFACHSLCLSQFLSQPMHVFSAGKSIMLGASFLALMSFPFVFFPASLFFIPSCVPCFAHLFSFLLMSFFWYLYPFVSVAPEAPRNAHNFISSNSTAASINLSSWRLNGCFIKNFVIQYKVKSKTPSEWILLSNNVVPEQRVIELVDLKPGTWYSLLVVAHSDPGPTEREYFFATLTDDGGKQEHRR